MPELNLDRLRDDERLRARDAEIAKQVIAVIVEALKCAGDSDMAERLEKFAPTLASLRYEPSGGTHA